MILLAIEDVTDRTRSDQARLAAARDEERRRIARELHDDLVQRLAGVAMELGGHAPGLRWHPQQHEKETRAIQGRVVEAAEVARRIAYQLHPSEVEDLGSGRGSPCVLRKYECGCTESQSSSQAGTFPSN